MHAEHRHEFVYKMDESDRKYLLIDVQLFHLHIHTAMPQRQM